MPKRPEPVPKLPGDWPVRGKLIGTGAAAQLLGTTRNALSTLCTTGKSILGIPYYKIGGVFRFDTEDIMDYLVKARQLPVI